MDDDFLQRNTGANTSGLAYQTRLNRKSITDRKWTMTIDGEVQKIEVASSAAQRLRGMLFRTPDDVTRLLVPCNDIHTFGMRYPLDIAFISRDGSVLEVHRQVAAKRRIKRKGASMVAERFSKRGDWLKQGDVIRLGLPDGCN